MPTGCNTNGIGSSPYGAKPSSGSASFREPEQLGELERHGRGQPLDVDEADVPRVPLDVRQVGPVDARPPGELLLRQAQRLAPALDRELEPLADVRPGPFLQSGIARSSSSRPV